MKNLIFVFLFLSTVLFGQVPSITSVDNIVTLNVTASGTQPFTYQWYKNDRPINGATSASLSIDTSRETGDFYVIVRNSAGIAKSDNIRFVMVRVAPAERTITTRIGR